MPCYRCGARQVDPVRGASPWKRGVRDGRQVLVCPSCQDSGSWAADLDTCPACGSTALVRRLGETVCRACGGLVADVAVDGRADAGPCAGPCPGSAPGGAQGGALARDVDEALDRVLGRNRNVAGD